VVLVSSSAAGRPRDPEVGEAILRATADLLALHGPHAMTLDAVAREAGCGKAAIYRRWAGKTELVVAAVQRLYRAPDDPDTGRLRDDLLVCARHYSGRDDRAARVLAGVLLESQNDPALRDAAYESVGRPPVEVLRRVLARGVERGDIPSGAPVDLITAIVPAVAFQRLVSDGRNLTESEVVELVDRVVLPALVARTPPQ
jgi:AcrR family transcriptional regulator